MVDAKAPWRVPWKHLVAGKVEHWVVPRALSTLKVPRMVALI